MSNKEIVVAETGEILQVSDVAANQLRAEIDQQIATAHAYPRNIKRVADNIKSMATLNERAAEESLYAVPRDGKTVRGPSARFAEIVVQQWGNCRVQARVVREEKDYIVAQAVFHDLETNVAKSIEVQRPIVGKGGKRYSPSMITTTGNAASSIASRNIILACVPRPVWVDAYEAAQDVVRGDSATLEKRRTLALDMFKQFGIKPEQIFAALDTEVDPVKSEQDITLDHLVTLRAMLASLKNGEATPDEMFGPKLVEKDPNYDPFKNPMAAAQANAGTGTTQEPKPTEKKQETSKKPASAG